MDKNKETRICEYYRTAVTNGKKPQMKQMAEQFGEDSDDISRLLDRAGLRAYQRRPQGTKNKFTVCPECGAQILSSFGASFCFRCGADIRDRRIKVREKFITVIEKYADIFTDDDQQAIGDFIHLYRTEVEENKKTANCGNS